PEAGPEADDDRLSRALSHSAEALNSLNIQDAPLESRILFMGPSAETMRRVSNKLDARSLARENGVSLFEGSTILSNEEHALKEAQRIGYPVILKLDAGGGGKGMFAVTQPSEMSAAFQSATRIGKQNYGNSDCYLEKLIEKPVHIEVQIFNGHAIGIRKCAVQRRNQKIIEESGDSFLDHHVRLKLLAAAEAMAHCSGYRDGGGAGTVEFLLDANNGEFGFLEMNTRLQVEYPVTDQSLQIDLAKWQLLHYDGRECEIPYENVFRQRFSEKEHAIECRIYAEDPWNDFAPAPGRIMELDLPTFNGVRCDFGFRKGDQVLPDYDPMIGKLIVRGKDRKEAIVRLERALSELYIAGLTSNVDQLLAIVRHPQFIEGNYSNLILSENQDLQRMEEKDPVQAGVFASVADFERRLRLELEETFRSEDLGDTLERIKAGQLPRGYRVKTNTGSMHVDLLRRGMGEYLVYVDGVPYCELTVQNRLEALDDLLISRDSYSSPVRVDHRSGFQSLRIMERDRKIRYYRLQLDPMGTEAEIDPPGTVRCPFSASFVQLGCDANGGNLQPGSIVHRGQTVLVISAMKMECQIVADRDGPLEYLLEDGKQDRLIRGRTADGLVLGRAIPEGELLFRVKSEETEDNIEESGLKFSYPERFAGPGGLFQRHESTVSQSELLELMGLQIHGYVHDPSVTESILEELGSTDIWNLSENEQRTLAGQIQDFLTLELMFSPIKERDQTYFGELNRLIRNWDNPEYQPSFFFRSVAARMLRRYGLDASSGRTDQKKLALHQMIRSRVQFSDYRRILVSLLSRLQGVSIIPELQRSLILLQRQDAPGDLACGRAARALLRQMAPVPLKDSRTGTGADSLETKLEVLDPTWPDFVKQEARRLLVRHTGNRKPGQGESKEPDWFASMLRYESGRPNVALYVDPENKTGFCLTWLEHGAPVPDRASDGTIRGIPNLEVAAREASKALRTMQQALPEVRWNLHLLGHGEVTDLDFRSSNPASFQYHNLMKVIRRLVVLYLPLPVESVIADFLAGEPGGEAKRNLFRISALNGRARLEMVPPEDPVHPEFDSKTDAATLRLLEKGKWTPEIWARATLDKGEAEEIRFAYLDGLAERRASGSGTESNGRKDTSGDLPRIGCRLFRGTMYGKTCLFYIKDSRINGGATGDLEGQMYVASVHYAFLLDCPLYIWNDGAGANIKEGMVSLNRAAEGFFFNALVSSRPDYHDYIRSCKEVQDPGLQELLESVELMVEQKEKPRCFFLAAVGMGSSTGLDVYGSSQAPIQIMLDDPGSFRVLTGSNVIKSVTGEDLTNYEIGGAPVMAQTGTVDRIARDKTELILEIRRLHWLMRPATDANAKQTSARVSELESLTGADYPTFALLEACSEGQILSLKEGYAAAGALGAWLVRLDDQPFLVMGPGEAGIRSTAAIYKARDLLRLADRLALPVILFFGKHWYRPGPDTEEESERIRARMDFLSTLQKSKCARYHLIMSPAGLGRVALNQTARALILVSNEKAERTETALHGIADFQEASVESALRRISEIHRLGNTVRPAAPKSKLEIPANSWQPFDMKAVLESLVDAESLLCWQDSQPERNLITATARFQGRAVAIIADQPLKGGVPDAQGTERFRKFVEKVNQCNLPLLMFSNAPGFLPGTQQERLRIQQIGGESLDVNVLSRIPVVSVVFRQNYGGRQIHAFSRFLRPGIYSIALKDAILAVMGAEAAFELFKQREYNKLLSENRTEEAGALRTDYIEAYRKRFRADSDAYVTGGLDETVEPWELRDAIIRGLQEASDRVQRWRAGKLEAQNGISVR
ncbi:MAG TPA: hypothetical protein DEA96_00370, partial [Leptospiraceae bacterium]|nr:hypothetical protein [Leptospiraceae bacterium]